MASDQTIIELPLTQTGGDVTIEAVNGKFLPNVFGMRLYDKDGHFIAEPLPTDDPDSKKPRITRLLHFPGLTLQGGFLVLFGAIPAPKPNTDYLYDVRVTATQANGNSNDGNDTGTFQNIEPINFRVNFV